MKYSFKKINIEAPFPTTQCGHSCQTFELTTFKDHLYARALGIQDDDKWIIHISFDLLAFDYENKMKLQNTLRDYYKTDKLFVITSATHTHYANSVRNPKYVEYLANLLPQEIEKMEYVEKNNVTTTYQRMHTNACGKSRISGYDSNNETLGLVRFFEGEDNFLNIVYNNCHPTTLDAMSQFFSAEYPGYVLKKLEDKYDADFTFMQGAAGDISSRFVRSGQSYEAMTELGDKLTEEVISLFEKETVKVPLKVEYKEATVKYEHEFTPIDLSNVRTDLSERELETIRIGSEERKKLEKKCNEIFGYLPDFAQVVSLSFGSIKFIFYPNEIFSAYMDGLDLDKELLVSYSNGYGSYILPIDFPFITYEMFTDTLSRKTKENIIETIRSI